MTRIAIVAALAAAGAALALTAVAGGRTNATTLRATVGPGFTITLTKNGRRVRAARARPVPDRRVGPIGDPQLQAGEVRRHASSGP